MFAESSAASAVALAAAVVAAEPEPEPQPAPEPQRPSWQPAPQEERPAYARESAPQNDGLRPFPSQLVGDDSRRWNPSSTTLSNATSPKKRMLQPSKK